MRLIVNGTERELESGASVADVARSIGVEPGARGIAVAVDGEVVPSSELASVELSEGQRVEVVTAIQGGS